MSFALYRLFIWLLQLFWFVSVLTWRGEKEGVFLRGGFEESQIRKSLKVVSEESGASLKGKRRGTRKRSRRNKRGSGGACSLLCKVCSDSETGCPECSHAEDRLNGGPGATEDRVPLSVIQLHKCILWERQEEKDRQLIGLAKNMCFPTDALIWLLATGVPPLYWSGADILKLSKN